VVGREFDRSLLQNVTEHKTNLLSSLELLKGLGLIQQIRVLPESSYRFKHPLIQEAAYEALLAHERKAIHGLIGQAIEQLSSGRLEENLDVLAHHFSMAEAWSKAVHYGVASAKKLKEIGQFSVALSQLERVRSWIDRLPE